MGIDVLPPNVSRSDWQFKVEGENVRYGLASIKGVGRSASEAIVAGRMRDDEEIDYSSVFDLCERADLGNVNRSTLEALVKAGAFDAPGVRRAQLSAVIERALSLGQSAAKDRSAGQLGLFGEVVSADAAPDYPDEPEWPEPEKYVGSWASES